MEIEGYKLLEKIGQGGMAQVFKGYQLSLKRVVAIKVLTKNLVDQKAFNQRFSRESLIIARLSSPYIIPVIERGISSDNTPYFVMEYIEGHDLKTAMEQDSLSFNRKLDITIQICKGLSYAHKNGVIHRDIKPANILIDEEGNAKVMDFGIAQYYEEEKDNEKTRADVVMGTVAYMSPEQIKSAALVTFKSDIYSLGVMLYKLFTRADPVGRFKEPSEHNPEIPSVLNQVILQCLETEPEARPESVSDIKDKLLSLSRGAHLEAAQRQRAQLGIKNFELLDVIKEDKFSAVYLYENKADNKLIMIKKRAVTQAGFTEAKVLSRLKHKNIINILGTSQNDKLYIIVMEYLSGGNLQDRLLNPFPWQEFIELAKEIMLGLSFAHTNRVIHGNLRPSNILFDHSNRIKLTDFGLIEHYHESKNKKNSYSIPKEKLNERSDIFAAGVIFHEMLFGTKPDIKADKYQDNIEFKRLPAKLKQIISKMLRVNPLERPASCAQVINVFEQIIEENEESKTRLIEKDPTTIIKNQSTIVKQAPIIGSLLFLLILLNLSLILAFYYFKPDQFFAMINFIHRLFS